MAAVAGWIPEARRSFCMTIHLPQELESSVRAEVLSGHFASEDDMVAAAVREYLRQHGQARPSGDPGTKNDNTALGSIGAMRDAAAELDEVIADTMSRAERKGASNTAT